MIASAVGGYLGADEVLQSDDPEVVALAGALRERHRDDVDFAGAAFEWVRDEVAHSLDVQDTRVTMTASEVLRERVGICFAKSHLLVALLRAEGIASGLCYQRVAASGGDGFALHGLVAVYLGGAWHRQDPRGNKSGINAQFSLGPERLAYHLDTANGEADYPRVYQHAPAVVLNSLRNADDALILLDRGRPSRLEA